MSATIPALTTDAIRRLLRSHEDRYHVRQDRVGPFRVVDATTETGIFETRDRTMALAFCRERNRDLGGADRCVLDGRCESCLGGGRLDFGEYDHLGNWFSRPEPCPDCKGTGRKLFSDPEPVQTKSF